MAEHAALSHEEEQAHRRWGRMSPAERTQAREEAVRAETARGTVPTNGRADEVGRWTEDPFELPHYAIHAALLPTGKVLTWGYPPFEDGRRPNRGEAALWDPSLGTGPEAFEEVPPPPIKVNGQRVAAPLYCSGQSFLANGALLVAGGNYVWPSADREDPFDDYAGLDTIFTFDPWSEKWIRQPSMEAGRWYPTQVLLEDGRTAIFGGFTAEPPGGETSDQLEIFTPSPDPAGVGTVTRYPEADQQGTLYPHLFTMPGGEVLMAGPYPENTHFLETDGVPSWSSAPNSEATQARTGGTGVIVPQGSAGSSEVMLMGGYGYGVNGTAEATASTTTLNAGNLNAGWGAGPRLQERRSYHNTVQLPDRTMVTVGGGIGRNPEEGNYRIDPDGDQRQVELFDPASQEWRLGPAQAEDRGYHSTAVLLPDGRVWSGGDDRHPTKPDGSPSDIDTGEIYSPPYLFRGARPSITRSPNGATFGRAMTVRTEGRNVKRAVLIAPAATTHAVDMHQRLVPLTVASRLADGRMRLKAPPSPDVAPPGYYMLFVVNAKGVPSVAKWIRLR